MKIGKQPYKDRVLHFISILLASLGLFQPATSFLRRLVPECPVGILDGGIASGMRVGRIGGDFPGAHVIVPPVVESPVSGSILVHVFLPSL